MNDVVPTAVTTHYSDPLGNTINIEIIRLARGPVIILVVGRLAVAIDPSITSGNTVLLMYANPNYIATSDVLYA